MQTRLKTNVIIIHCSDSPDNREDIGVKDITEWHKQRGWETCGYHYVVKRDGSVEAGRSEVLVGAHTEGFNGKSLGICWVGRTKPTAIQYARLLKLIKQKLKVYNLTADFVKGHKEFNSKKTCPNLDMNKLRADLKATEMSMEKINAFLNLTPDPKDTKFDTNALDKIEELNTNPFGKEESHD